MRRTVAMTAGRRWARGRFAPLLLLAACSGSQDGPAPPATAEPLQVTDAEGRQIRLSAPASRIVSLVPSATLTLAAIGAAGAVVARTDHDTASWMSGLPSVGGGLYPSLESVVAAHPDLVVRFGGPQDTKTPVALDDLGIPHLAIRPDRISDILATVRILGEVTGRGPEATALIERFQVELDGVRAAASGLAPVRVAYLLGGTPPWVAGPGTYIHELVELAGGVNAFGDIPSLYASVSVEEFVARDIDLILTTRGSRLDPRIFGSAKVAVIDDGLELPGPALAEAAWKVFHLLHPDQAP